MEDLGIEINAKVSMPKHAPENNQRNARPSLLPLYREDPSIPTILSRNIIRGDTVSCPENIILFLSTLQLISMVLMYEN
jgi:hypothetical protein